MTSPDVFGPTEVPEQYQEMVLHSADRWEIPTVLLAAQINQESGFDPNAKSPDGAIGIAQFMPDTAEENGVDPLDPGEAIDGMAKLMHLYKQRFGSWEQALIAYHDGPNKVYSPSENAKDYVGKILGKVGSLIGEKPGEGPDFIPDIPNPIEAFTGLAKIIEKLRDPVFLKRMGIGALGVGMLLVAFIVISGGRGFRMAGRVLDAGGDSKATGTVPKPE